MNEIIGRPFFQYVKIPPDLSFSALAALDYLQFSINEMGSLWPLHFLEQIPSPGTETFHAHIQISVPTITTFFS